MTFLNPKTIARFVSLEKIEKAGYLGKKRTENKKQFKKRYFVAVGNLLVYYENKGDREPIGIIFLEGHVVDLVDDLTMSISFPNPYEGTQPYYLRSDSSEDIEQWMRILARSGIDFINSTLDGLEKTYRGHNIEHHQPGAVPADLSPITTPHRGNPFNTGVNHDFYQPAPSSSSKSPSCPVMMTATSSSNSAPATSTTNAATSSLPPSTSTTSSSRKDLSRQRNLHWLFNQSWDQLHSLLGDRFSSARKPVDNPPVSSSPSSTV